MTKYREYVERMLKENNALFTQFQLIHDKYNLDQKTHQAEFNKVGEEVMKVVRDYEARLCSQSETGGYSDFVGNLAQKFQDEIKKRYPLIDHVGIVVKEKPSFSLKKISLS